MVYPLHELKPGERAEIVWVISEPPMSLRLEELGFTAPGTGDLYSEGEARPHDPPTRYRTRSSPSGPKMPGEVLVRPLQPV